MAHAAGTICVILCALMASKTAAKVTGWKFVDDHGIVWLEGPDGKRMLSKGVDCIGPGPDGKDFNPENPAYGPPTRGGEAFAPWRERTLARLKGWGFNTAAGWSDARMGKDGLPFTPVLHIGVQLGMPWGDPWDPGLPAKAREMAERLVAPTRGDPNRIGYFLDNEFGWGDDWMLGIALGWDAKAPGRAHLVEVLRKTYGGDFKVFAAEFETTATGWDGLLATPGTATRAGRGYRALDAWVEAVVRQYNEVLAGAVRAADPGALILGDRYRQFYPQAVARAARGVLDAVSTNYEAHTRDGWISPAYFLSLHECSGLPVLVGEYYATARQNRSGNRNHDGVFTLMDTQAERAAVAAAQARAFAAFPFVAGWHWFQWMDEPVYGRDDGEDYNMGLVDIYDEPYAEMTAALAAENAAADGVHAGSGAKAAAWRGDGFKGPLTVARQDGQVVDGKLDDWDKSVPVPRSVLKTPEPVRPFGDVFVAWDPGSLRLAVRAYDFSIPAKNTPSAKDPATWGDLHRLTIIVDGVTVKAATGYTAAPGAKEAAWVPVTFVVPPARGAWSAAVASHLDRWHYVWEVAIPAVALGGAPLAAGRTLSLALAVENRGDFEAMRIASLPLVLGPAAFRAGAP